MIAIVNQQIFRLQIGLAPSQMLLADIICKSVDTENPGEISYFVYRK